ncbi:uncharacterized protein FFB20_07951 [Fusarium fujikuroi]|nr:uncharacterized protein FFB20_07951 [Fusarium fujikuroi]SCN92548.1 uncharacterized protein FFE2_07397 [Fusarium fujikuroi]SCO42487.1 uncharacterized protein FFNC_08548 [Fusarium fujikuroi]
MATFPQFAKLPIELRDMIWEQALKKDRVLRLYEKRTLYLRPELDTIRRGLTEGFGRLAHCVWAMDRLHVGLVNLAPDLQVKFSGFNGLAWKDDYFPKDIVEGELWKDGLRRLQNVSFQDTIPGYVDPRWADLQGMRVSATFWFRLLAREGITLSQEVNYGCLLSQRDTLHQCLPNRTEKCQCAGELFIQDLRAKGTEVVPGYWLLSMDYLVFVKNYKGELKSNRYNPILEELSVLFELCIRQLTAYKELTGIVDCRRRHLWKTS